MIDAFSPAYQESGLARLARTPAPDGDGTTVGISDAPLALGNADLAAIRARCEAATEKQRKRHIHDKPVEQQLAACQALCDPDCEGRCNICPQEIVNDAISEIKQLRTDIPALLSALTAALAEGERLRADRDGLVPISDDGHYVFIDGPGDVELDHQGKMRAAIATLTQQLSEAQAEGERLTADLHTTALQWDDAKDHIAAHEAKAGEREG